MCTPKFICKYIQICGVARYYYHNCVRFLSFILFMKVAKTTSLCPQNAQVGAEADVLRVKNSQNHGGARCSRSRELLLGNNTDKVCMAVTKNRGGRQERYFDVARVTYMCAHSD